MAIVDVCMRSAWAYSFSYLPDQKSYLPSVEQEYTLDGDCRVRNCLQELTGHKDSGWILTWKVCRIMWVLWVSFAISFRVFIPLPWDLAYFSRFSSILSSACFILRLLGMVYLFLSTRCHGMLGKLAVLPFISFFSVLCRVQLATHFWPSVLHNFISWRYAKGEEHQFFFAFRPIVGPSREDNLLHAQTSGLLCPLMVEVMGQHVLPHSIFYIAFFFLYIIISACFVTYKIYIPGNSYVW